MLATPVDPRDWAIPNSRATFRVYFWYDALREADRVGHGEFGLACSEWQLTGVGIEDLVAWVKERAPVGTVSAQIFCDLWNDDHLAGSAEVGSWRPDRRQSAREL